MLDRKLQLKDGQTIALIHNPYALPLAAPTATPAQADALLAFVVNASELQEALADLQAAAERQALVWVAYPKARQLGTDINRDLIRTFANDNGLDPVRQIAIDDTWSALRLKTLA